MRQPCVAGPGVNNNLTVSVGGGNYTFADSGETITLTATALAAGWTGSGTNTVTGPTASVTGAITSIDLGNGINTATIQSLNNNVNSLTGTAGTNTLVGPNAATTWNINTANAGSLPVSGSNVNFSAVQNLTGGSGDDTFVFADAASVAGTIDGGAGTNTLNYTAYSTPVAVNLGLNVPSLTASLDSSQETPPTTSTATGTATITNYNPVARTFDIAVTVTGILPAEVTGFHIHRAPVGVAGPIIIDFGTAGLVATPTGFTFNATGVALPDPAHEAALLGGLTYLNVHTPTFPNGAIRGQLYSTGNTALATGTATGTGRITNIQNATGGSARLPWVRRPSATAWSVPTPSTS